MKKMKSRMQVVRQILTLVLILTMTMSFATMTAAAADNTCTIHVGSGMFDNKTELLLHMTSGDLTALYQGSILKVENQVGYNTGKEIPFTVNDNSGKSGVIVITKHEGNDAGQDETFHFDQGNQNYNGTVYYNVDVKVSKSWVGDDELQSVRPDEITAKLLANGTATGKSVVLNEENGWKGSFSNLVKFQNGKEISYTVEEEAVEGYDPSVSGTEAEGYIITNTYTRPVTGSMKISKQVVDAQEKPLQSDDTVFTFTVETGDKKPVVLSESAAASNVFSFEKADSAATATELRLKAGDEITIEGLPTGTYIVSEAQEDGYTLLYVNGEKPEGQSKAYQVTSKEIASACFVNQKAAPIEEDTTGMLKIKKQVADAEGNYITDATAFTFTVETAEGEALVLEKSATADDTYIFVRAEEKGKKGTELQLKGGEEITIQNLPAGSYKVTEADAEGYSLASIDAEKPDGQSKTYRVESKATTYSLFVNEKKPTNSTKPTDPITIVTPTPEPTDPGVIVPDPESPLSPAEPENPGVDVDDENVPQGNATSSDTSVPKTGDNGAGAASVLFFLSAAGLAALAVTGRRKENAEK
ncbi:MAG: Cna B-type domain-containing protein [Firmicutes bacterium]|nr:Cna B-type domain-containing protein [Bacillota bacterium]